MSAEVKPEKLLTMPVVEPETQEDFFETVALELMAVLDHVEENYGDGIATDMKLLGANKLHSLYLLWRQGEVSLPWLAEQLANALAKNHSRELPKARGKSTRQESGH